MNGALTGIVLVLLWGMVLARLPTLWRDARQRAMWAMLFSLALTRTVATPSVNALAGEVLPAPQVVPHLLAVVATFFLIRLLSLITDYDATHPWAARMQLLLTAAVLATLIGLLAATPGGIRTKGTELLSTAIAPTAAAYWVVLNGYLSTVLVIATALCWRIGRSAPPGALRDGLHAIATGTALITLYAVLKTVLIVLHSLGVTLSVDRIEPAADALRNVGFIACVVGAAVPAAGKLSAVLHAYRALRALRPLWDVMRRTFPEVILDPPRRTLLPVGLDDVQLRLYRRVIEIRDGMMMLRDQLPAGTLAAARGYVGADPALIEACGLALALRRHRSGAAPAGPGDRWTDTGGEIADEVAWLGAVSAAFRRAEPAAFARHRDETAAR